MNDRGSSIIGIMSGSSLDGMDIALIHFHSVTNFEWRDTIHIPYDKKWKEGLRGAAQLDTIGLLQLHSAYAEYQFNILHECGIPLDEVEAIAWHGHTIFHEPHHGFSFALGDCQRLASKIGIPCFGNFRDKDISLGGQGAPLAPIVDKYFFSDWDACINLGGIANISFPSKEQAAYDLCACNQVLDYLAQKAGKSMDYNGSISRQGNIDPILLEKLNEWTFLKRIAPKSLSNQEVQSFYFPILQRESKTIPSALRTCIAHICQQIHKAIDQEPAARILLSGGGAYNQTLLTDLISHFPKGKVKTVQEPWASYKEAFLMSFMAYLHIVQRPNVLSSQTGSTHDHIGGLLYKP